MHTWDRLGLFACAWLGVPAFVEENKHHVQFVLLRNAEELIKTGEEFARTLHPDENVKKDSQSIHSQSFTSPFQFAFDRHRIECRLLPHLEHIDRCRRHIVSAQQPRMSGVPSLCSRRCPATLLNSHATLRMERQRRSDSATYRCISI